MRPKILPMILLSFAAASLGAQGNETAGPTRAVADKALPVYDALGTYSRKVTTASVEAQSYFDQGVRLTFGFGHGTARLSFREAIKRDSTCAMCWWGLAWSLGPYINARMDSMSGVEAYSAIQAAKRNASRGTAAEKAFIDAMATRYAAIPIRTERAALDSAYANAMRDVMKRFPNDLDAASLFGESLMVLRPWDQWTRTGEPNPGTPEVISTLESVLTRNPRHPGACHHYIHATEASNAPQRAAACADLLGAIIPGASHIPHMPSHTYMRIGRYGDAVRANQDAVIADLRAAYGGVPGIYPPHNLNMLYASAAMDGQSGIATQAARDLDRRYPTFGSHEPLMLARFGRWDEILGAPPPTGGLLHATAGAFSRGLAHLAKGRARDAGLELSVLDALMAGVGDSAREVGHPARSMIGIPRAILSAEISAKGGKFDKAGGFSVSGSTTDSSLSGARPRVSFGACNLSAGLRKPAGTACWASPSDGLARLNSVTSTQRPALPDCVLPKALAPAPPPPPNRPPKAESGFPPAPAIPPMGMPMPL